MEVGVDIGGSGVRAGTVAPDGGVSDVRRVRLADRDPDTVIAAVVEAIGERRPARVGVGVPGFVRGRTVLASPNFPAWRDFDLGARLEERLGVGVAVENDANAAAVGAWARGGRQGDLVLLTLGTGVGGGIVSGGRLLRGSTGTGAEVGHLWAGGERPCGCGGQGCLETWCSTNGLRRAAEEAGHTVADGEEVVVEARAGAPWAVAAVTEAGRRLGLGLVTLVNLFEPDVIALAGGLSLASDLLGPPAEGWLRRYGIRPNAERVRLQWLGRADDLAIAGAAAAARGEVR